MKKLPLENSTMKEISVRVRSFSSTRSFSFLSNSPEEIFSFLFFRLNLFFIFFGLDWLHSGLFVWVWSRRFVRVQTGCVLVCLCWWGSHLLFYRLSLILIPFVVKLCIDAIVSLYFSTLKKNLKISFLENSPTKKMST